MDNEIRKQNKVPGSCEQFTRPEEILGLQKYLRDVKDVYESQLELGKDNLEVTRRASIREVDQLPDNIQILDTRKGTSELISNKEWLEADKKIEILDAMRVKLEGKNETILKPFKEKLDSPIKIESLEDHLEIIDDEREVKLNKNKEGLTDTRKISLPNHKESIRIEELSKLSDHQERLKETKKIELENTKIKLEKEENNSLSGTKINLGVQTNSELENHIERLSTEELKNLEDHKEKLKGTKQTELENTRIILGEVDDIKLGNTRIDLGKQQEPELEKYKDSLEVNEKIKLEDYQEKILVDSIDNLEKGKVELEDNRKVSLYDEKVKLNKTEETELENTRINIENTKKISLEDKKVLLTETEEINNLGNTKVTINPTKINELEGTKISLNNNNDIGISLPNSKIELRDINDPVLGEDKKNIPNEIKEIHLENHLEIIQPNKDNTISNTKITIERIEETKNLSDILIKGIEEKSSELENHIERLSTEELKNLEDHKEIINPNEILELEDTKVNLEVKENNSLSETKIELNITSENELSNFIDTLETENNISLEDIVIKKPGVIFDTELGDTKIRLKDDREISLEDALIGLEETDDNISLHDDSTKINLIIPENPSLHDEFTKININPLDIENLSDVKIERGGTESDPILYDNNIKIIGEIEDKELHGDETLQKLTSDDVELSDIVIKREGEDPENILHSDSTKINLSPNTDNISLHDDSTKINLIIPENPSLHDEFTKININPLDIENLSDVKIERGGEKDFENKLYDESTRFNLNPKETELEEKIIKRSDDVTIEGKDNKEWNEEDGLEDFLLKNVLDDTTKEDLEGNTHKKFDPDNETLYDSALVRPDDVTIEGKDNKEFNPDEYTSESFDKEREKTTTLIEDDTTKEDLEGNTHKKFDPEEDKLNNSTVLRPEDDETKENLRYELGDDGELKLVKDALNHDDYNGDDLENLGKNRTQSLTEDLGKEDDLKTAIKNNNDEELEKILKERSIDDLELYKKNLLGYAKKLEGTALGGWSEKIQSLISAYLSGDEISKERAENFERELYNSLLGRDAISLIKENQFNPEEYNFEYDFGDDRWGTGKSLSVPMYNGGWAPKCDFKSVGGALDSLNISNYLRYIAETTVGLIPKGAGKALRRTRALLLDETLALLVVGRDALEKVTKSNRDRLPGNGMGILGDLVSGGAKKAMNSAVDSLVGSIFGSSGPDLSIPNNRPDEDGDTKEFILLSSKGQGSAKDNSHGGFFKRLGNSLMGKNPGESTPFNEYLKNTSGTGFATTLKDLIGTDINNIKSVEQLMESLKLSPYYTTSDKVGASKIDTTVVNTLDSNIYWEIIFEPFIGKENGGLTYLPAISSINSSNLNIHGSITSYGKWIPVNSFELGKSKLTSKTLSLFDGEISYPTSLEFTNEFRLTFVDDQYKSWRTYFERCIDSMIYYSRPSKNGSNYVVNKNYVCLAPYKNVTFRCTIYSMTPQLSTISKYDLLLVLKDFTEERSGEIDGAATDLTVTFSIVGENPSSELPKIEANKNQGKKTLQKPKGDVSSIISDGVKSGLNIIM